MTKTQKVNTSKIRAKIKKKLKILKSTKGVET